MQPMCMRAKTGSEWGCCTNTAMQPMRMAVTCDHGALDLLLQLVVAIRHALKHVGLQGHTHTQIYTQGRTE